MFLSSYDRGDTIVHQRYARGIFEGQQVAHLRLIRPAVRQLLREVRLQHSVVMLIVLSFPFCRASLRVTDKRRFLSTNFVKTPKMPRVLWFSKVVIIEKTCNFINFQ